MSSEIKEPQNASDCYSAGERGWMEWGQRLRAILFRPSLRILIKLGVTADGITLLGAVIGIAFMPAVLLGWHGAAISCLVLHVLLDGLDGPLARETGNASSRGSFTDTFADQVVVTVVIIAWMILGPSMARVSLGAIYIFLYTLVVAMSMVRNVLAIPYSWLVRPRFFVYAAIALDLWLATNWTIIILCIANTLLALKVVTGFFKLRRRLPGPDTSEG